MKKTLLSLTLVFAILTVCTAQQIEIKKVFGGYKYKLDGKNLTIPNLAKTVETNEQAFQLINKAKTNRIVAGIVGCIGSGMIGWQTGTSSAGGNANWALAGVGAGLVAICIPISLRADKNIKQAVTLYNNGLTATSNNNFKPEVNMIANKHGVGLAMNF